MDLDLGKTFEKIFDCFKRVTPALLAVTLFTGSIIFMPTELLAKMKLNNISDSWMMLISIVFLISIALVISIFICSIYRRISERIKYKKFLERKKKQMKKLSSNQKNILYALLNDKSKRIDLDTKSGDVIYLVENGYITIPRQTVSVSFDNEMVATYIPQPWLVDMYTENSNCLQ